MTEKTCPQCAETVKANAKICRYCNYNFETGTPAGAVAGSIPPKKSGKVGKGCLIVVGVLVLLIVIGAIAGGDKKDPAVNARSVSQDAAPAGTAEAPISKLTGAQQNALRTAEQYISMAGFSRKGLIDQLSSDAGNGYDVGDATAAVDSMDIDWNEQAARSAKQYLDMTGFSCKGLIQQLSSSAGSKYTTSEATFGAKQAGAC